MPKKILIADRKSEFRSALKEYLSAKEYNVILAEDDVHFYEILNNDRELPDIILMGVLFPKKGGYEVCKDIKSKEYWKHIPIILMGEVLVSLRLQQQARYKYGANECLVTPAQSSEIERILKTFLGGETTQKQPSKEESSAKKVTKKEEEYLSKEEVLSSLEVTQERVPKEHTPIEKVVKKEPIKEIVRDSIFEKRQPLQAEKVSIESKIEDKVGIERRKSLTDKKRGVPVWGDLSQTPFLKLSGHAWNSKLTGSIIINHHGIVKKILFKKGQPVFVESIISHETLGRFLIAKGVITEKIYWESLQKMITSKKKLGEVLIESGKISSYTLFNTLILQIEEKIQSIFGWNEGEYIIRIEEISPEKEIVSDIQFPSLILNGIRRFYPLKRLKAIFDNYKDSIVYRGEQYPNKSNVEPFLKPQERRLISQINEKETLNQLIAKSQLDEEQAYSFIYYLLGLDTLYIENSEKLWKLEELDNELIDIPKEGPAIGNPQEIQKIINLINREFPNIMSENPYQIFNLVGIYDELQLKTSYYTLIEKFRPEKFYRLFPKNVQYKSDKIVEKLTKYYEILLEELKKSSLKKGISKEEELSKNIIKSELYFIEGVNLIKSRQYQLASESFQKAIRLVPTQAEYKAYLGWSIYKNKNINEKERLTKGVDIIKEALLLNPVIEYGHLFLGKIYKTQNELEKALEEFDLALQANPNSSEAMREKELIKNASKDKEKEAITRPKIIKTYEAEKPSEDIPRPVLKTGIVEEPKESPPLSPEEKEYIEKLNAFHKKLETSNYFEILGVERGADEEECRRAYFALAKIYHPDRIYAKLSPEIKEKADEVFTALVEAHDTLTDSKKRRLYERSVFPKEEPQDDESKAQKAFENGKIYMKGKRFNKAVDAFKSATELVPDNAEYQAYLGYAVYLSDSGSKEERLNRALRYLKIAQKLDESLDKIYLFLGKIYKRENNPEKAEENFQIAVKYNPKCYEAIEELRNIKMKRGDYSAF